VKETKKQRQERPLYISQRTHKADLAVSSPLPMPIFVVKIMQYGAARPSSGGGIR
jgi:hypothetical protein